MGNNIGKHQYWAVAFLDLLGQGQLMSEIDYVPDESKPEEVKKFKEQIGKVYNAVVQFRKSFNDFVTSYYSHKDEERLKELNDEQLKMYDKMQPEPLTIQRFSDGIMIYMPLSNFENKSPCSGLFCMLAACAVSQIRSLALGMPFRGGIDVATGIEMEDNDLYGPVVYNTYTLENKYAQYPRVLVGDGFINYLKQIVQSDEISLKMDLEKKLAKRCYNILMQDFDGRFAIHFLGKNALQYYSSDIKSVIIDKAFKYVVGQYNKTRTKKDTKLAFRYSILMDYFIQHVEQSHQNQDEN